ncbi:XdhC family aldehyde oxidoreductase maturation factor [Desulforhopalus singaporensis]|uniref:Xanthine dehydrogenase accessory factor n=1 Tax=Desulforhopalus singaporensis TaxID=91360 RepID=A0A1H0US30_9BACT|nr:XdhC/CoxI family protein [Desulforhopalus singaporensis]SDP69007.1 xanthine dehydrogenase accessory factor [Desulforhopalus singaporensis]
MREILDSLVSELKQQQTVVIAVIIRSAGSAPRTLGARMLVRKDGSVDGTIGGGALEGKCIQKARDIFLSSAHYLEVDYSLSSPDAAELGMVCGGSVSLLMQKIEPDMLETFVSLQADCRQGKHPALLTILPQNGNSPHLIPFCESRKITSLDEKIVTTLNRDIGRAPYLLHTEKSEIFVEPLASPSVVFVIGAGHVGYATAKLAAFADFEVVVIDDRDEFANADRFENVKEIKIVECFSHCFSELSDDDYVVIVTRGHLHDKDVLAQALKTKAGYIGMIGSTKKRNFVYQSLVEEGFSQNDFNRVSSPIGLDIGADTPHEIALSIVSELVKTRSKKRVEAATKRHSYLR